MQKGRIPFEMQREYRRARNIGALLDLVLPLAMAVVVVLVGGTKLEAQTESLNAIRWLKYGLVAFSVTVCIVARITLSRMMGTLREQVRRGVFSPGRLLYCYLTLYALYLVPSAWGLAYFLLTGGLLLFLVLVAITVVSYLLLTPGISQFFR